jgi:hypothetical protein
MTFRLLIECSKDIDKLSIDFSDGTSMVQHTPDPDPKPKNSNPRVKRPEGASNDEESKPSRADAFIDTDAEFGTVSQEVVSLPTIPVGARPVKVAEELQNMDF